MGAERVTLPERVKKGLVSPSGWISNVATEGSIFLPFKVLRCCRRTLGAMGDKYLDRRRERKRVPYLKNSQRQLRRLIACFVLYAAHQRKISRCFRFDACGDEQMNRIGQVSDGLPLGYIAVGPSNGQISRMQQVKSSQK